MPRELDYHPVLRQFPAASSAGQVVSLGGAGGFSGARLWQLGTPAGMLCLRAWPEESPTPERLAWIHRVLRHVASNRDVPVPTPFATWQGETFVAHAGRQWELTPWMPGVASYWRDPTIGKLHSAMQMLARFHLAAATHDLCESSQEYRVSPAILQRREQLEQLLAGGFVRLRAARPQADWPEFNRMAEQWFALFEHMSNRVFAELTAAQNLKVPLSPCLRDVWHDHILFTGETVTGLVDFGAMRVDSVAADIARLLGSLVGDQDELWDTGLAAYQCLRSISANEQRLIPIFDLSSQLLAIANWIEWVALDGREFSDRPAIEGRITVTLARLEHRRSGLGLDGKLADKGSSGKFGTD